MAYPKFGQLVQDVIKEAGLVDGSAVQFYTEPQVQIAINSMFSYLMEKDNWEHLCEWRTFTPDGTTGCATENFSDILEPEDFLQIRFAQRKALVVPARENDYLFVTGTMPIYYTPLMWNDPLQATKLIRIWPKTATEVLSVRVKVRPSPFVDPDDVVPFNNLIIKMGSLWYLMAGDGLNPGNAQKAQTMFEQAYADFVTRINKADIGYGTGYFGDTFALQPS